MGNLKLKTQNSKLLTVILLICVLLCAVFAAACAKKDAPAGPSAPANTHTVSPTSTVSATISPTHSVTPTRTCSPSRTSTRTITNTRTATVTRTHTVTRTATPTPTRTKVYTYIYSTAGYDGRVSSDGTFAAGQVSAYVGDTTANATAQVLLSFSITTVTQPVVMARLYIDQSGTSGLPFTDLGGLYVNHLLTDYTTLGLGPEDYLAPGSIPSWIGPISTSPAGLSYWLDVTAELEADRLAARATSQYRLFFLTATDNDSVFDIVYINMSEASTGRPYLMIEY